MLVALEGGGVRMCGITDMLVFCDVLYFVGYWWRDLVHQTRFLLFMGSFSM